MANNITFWKNKYYTHLKNIMAIKIQILRKFARQEIVQH